MGKLTLYGYHLSPSVRAVLLTLEELKLPYEFKLVDLTKGEHLTPEYRQKNPQHTIPTLEDDGHFIWDSHAISAYLVNKYGKTDELYPKEPLKRAVVDQRLHFESSALSTTASNITKPLLLLNETMISKTKIAAVNNVYDLLEKFLQNHTYMAGDNLTIADFSLLPTVTTLSIYVDINDKNYPKVAAWVARLKQLPYYEEANGKGFAQLAAFIKSKNFTLEQ